jgi:hypothetical protein
MGYALVDVEDVPYRWGTFKFVRQHLGATAFGFTQIDFPPDKVGAEHDETARGRRRSISRSRAAGHSRSTARRSRCDRAATCSSRRRRVGDRRQGRRECRSS